MNLSKHIKRKLELFSIENIFFDFYQNLYIRYTDVFQGVHKKKKLKKLYQLFKILAGNWMFDELLKL